MIVMRKRTNETLRLTALAAALVSVYGAALAEEPQGSVSVGGGGWTNDRHQAGEYDGMRDKGAYAAPGLDADIQKRDDESGISWGLKVRNLGLQTREIKGEVERQGDIGGSIEYSRIPYDNPYTINTGVLGTGGTRQIVPSPSIVPGTGRDLELGTVRDRFTTKFFKNLGEGFSLNLTYRTEDKDGSRQWGRGGAPEFAVEPINSTTRQWEAVLNYADARLQVSGGYSGTSYQNSNGIVVSTLSTPAIPTGASTINLTLPLDNQSHQFFVDGGYNFTPTTRGTFKASYTRATQDERLPSSRPDLLYTAAQAPSPLAPTSLNGKVDTTLVEAGLTSRPIQDLSIVANLRYRNLDDKTPIKGLVFSGLTPTVFNTPWSYKTWTGKVDATYRLQDGYSLIGGAEYSSQDRWVPSKGETFVPFRSDLDELTLRAGVRKAMSETVNGSLTYSYSNRDGGHYDVPGSAANPGENLINPLNIADRKRNKVRGLVDWAPLENFTLTLTGDYAHDDYSGLPFGLQKGKAYGLGLDGSYQLNKDWSINAWISWDQTKADETTQRWDAGPVLIGTKDNNLKETGTSFGMGFRGAVDKLKLGADLERFRSVNKYDQNINGGALPANVVPLPDITNKMLRLKAFAQYPVQKNADIRFNFIYEKWHTDDWTWMLQPASGPTPFVYGTGTDGTSVFADQKQHSVFGGLRYTYRFD